MKEKLKKAATSLTLIIIVALVIRVAFLVDYKAHNSDRAVSVIPFLFESGNIAHSIAMGKGFSSPFRIDTGPTAWMTPVYPLLLAAIFKVFGAYTVSAWFVSVSLNMVFVTLACIPIYFAGRRIGGEKYGVALGATAAWLWAIFPNAVLMPVESMWEASLAALLGATILWATLTLEENRGLRAWCAYGLLWGFTLMTNATLGALLPFLLVWLGWRARIENRSVASRVAVTVALAASCCVPWTVRNYQVFHQLVPLRSVLGLQLWLGNNDETQDIFRGDLHPIYNQSERQHYVTVGEIAYMQEKRDLATSYMFSHPAREAHLIWLRFVSIWAGGAIHPIDDFVGTPDPWFRYVLAFNILVAFGTLAGVIVLLAEHNVYSLPCAVFPAIFPWAYYMTLALPRYRLPIDPINMLLASVALLGLIRRFTSKSTVLAQQPRRSANKKSRQNSR
ncbi:MAG: glycosyltransferase family 39 protein [Candidatus Acidiferrales bacterium]